MKRTIPLLIVCLVFAADASAQVARRPFLFKDARGELAAARARGDTTALLVIASMPSANARVARRITELGGTIGYRDDDVDYLRARVPVENVQTLVADRDVHSVDISIRGMSRTFGMANEEAAPAGRPEHSSPSTEAAPVQAQSPLPFALPGFRSNLLAAVDTPPVWPPRPSDLPLVNRYDPTADIGAAEFRRNNPTFDGRGVTLALIDMSMDPLLPELQSALTLDGQPTRKIVAYETVLDLDEEDDGRWLKMETAVTAAGGTFTAHDTAYTAPRDGAFRFDRLDEAKFDSLAGSGLEKDLNRDKNPEGSSRMFGVLWDENTNDVWVDTDQDRSFTDEKALTDYSARQEFGVFGKDDPATPVRESVGYAIQIDKARKRVSLNVGTASHASLVVGAAVASRGTAGRFDGVAPGAMVANVAEGGSAYGQTEAVIRALKNPLVDLAFLEQSSLITRNYLLRDGRLVPTVIYSRLIEKYGKPLLVPTHNYPVLGAPDDFVLANGAIGIGGHESKQNFFLNHGVRVQHDDNLLITGGYGPMGNGALAPDVISPSNYVSTARGYQEGTAIAGLFQLPPGYTIAGGTSTATPTASGGVALLISAARQTGIDHDAFRIKHAITSSARWVPHLDAYRQGNGVINIGAAWEILKAMDGKPLPITITTEAPVRHPMSNLLHTPNEGVGLYEREGWSVGDRADRVVTFTRTSGPREAMTFDLRWTGNDAGTFSAPASVALPLNQPTPVTIAVAPAKPGVHSAILALENATVPGVEAHRMMAAIVATTPFTAEKEWKIEDKAEVPRPGMQSLFYTVPEGVAAIRFDLTGSNRVSLAVTRPDTRAERIGQGSSAPTTYVVNNPMPGLWEVRLTDISDTRSFDWEQASKEEPVPVSKTTLTVSLLAVDLRMNAVNDGPAAGEPEDQTFDMALTNRLAPFTGLAASYPLGSAHSAQHTIRQNEQLVFEVDVPKGSRALLARTAGLSDASADLDVYVFDCTEEKCRGSRADGDPIGDEHVLVENPAAGKWKIVVDGNRVPSGSVTFEYLDVVFNPTFGMVNLTDVPEERKKDASWSARANVWASSTAHAEGRSPFAAVLVEMEGRNGARLPLRLHELGSGSF